MIYFDNSATTKPDPSVLESFLQISQKYYGNPSSVHRFGLEAETLLRKAHEQAAEILRVTSSEIIFTSGGTEGNNTAIKGIALAHQNRGNHIITTQIEHPSVLEACHSLETLGFDVTYLPVNEHGTVDVKDVKQALTDKTILVSIMHINNELGSIQPIEAIGQLIKKRPTTYFHVDHVQGFGKQTLPLHDSGIDLCTISGHKIHGLKGTGILYVKKGTTLFSLFHGGNQQGNYRSGTENVAGDVSLVKAMRLIKEQEINSKNHLDELNQLLRELLQEIPEIMINTSPSQAPQILNFSIPGYKPEVIIHALGEREIFISTKSACSSKKPDESAVLHAVGFSQERSKSGLRVSLSYQNTKEEIELFCRSLRKVIQQLSKVMG
ncbi:cysteine desulfurase IscS [Paraliobacillus ryukyuensis]|uniref:Cysteine desulfurase n=1 Tax=Paraliobacillus ryukyuensis TaxID=200904 RepID=A0A366ED01_9BACI|nr:cysteine desulfurase family protein [Paraliobacillus ryukyuensis]RBO99374.1 cysteine desulfurase [Paraliobacillus ryukyuensis]